MAKEFWHNLITEKSFELLQDLRKRFDFVLIGGWAVYLYTQSLKSRDIDMIVDLETLGQLKQKFEVYKNERLKKYEIKMKGIDIDIYIPYWSDLGLPAESIIKETVSLEGFNVPKREILLVLKLFVYSQRKSSLKGKKDLIDIISLLYFNKLDYKKFEVVLRDNDLLSLKDELYEILTTTISVEELDLNQKKFSDLKKKILPLL